MLEILQFTFVQNAILVSFFIGITSGIVGSLIVVNRIVFVAGGISHGAYGGVGLSVFFGLSPIFGILGFTLFLALIIAYMSYINKTRIDSIIGVIWAFGMAFGIILVDISPGYNIDMMSFLFGSILSISSFDLYFIGIVCIFIFTIILFFYKEFLSISFDIEFAKLQGINVKLFHTMLIIMIALCVIATIRTVGLILTIALLTIPPYIAEKFCSKLYKLMLLSSLLSISFSLFGFALSFILNLTASACIIIVASVVFFIVEILFYLKMNVLNK